MKKPTVVCPDSGTFLSTESTGPSSPDRRGPWRRCGPLGMCSGVHEVRAAAGGRGVGVAGWQAGPISRAPAPARRASRVPPRLRKGQRELTAQTLTPSQGELGPCGESGPVRMGVSPGDSPKVSVCPKKTEIRLETQKGGTQGQDTAGPPARGLVPAAFVCPAGQRDGKPAPGHPH